MVIFLICWFFIRQSLASDANPTTLNPGSRTKVTGFFSQTLLTLHQPDWGFKASKSISSLMTYRIPVFKKSSLSAVLRQKYESLLLLIISMMGSLLDYLTEQDFLYEIIPHHKTESMSPQFWVKHFGKRLLVMWTCFEESIKLFPAFSQWCLILSQNSFQTVSVFFLIHLVVLAQSWLIIRVLQMFYFLPVFLTLLLPSSG